MTNASPSIAAQASYWDAWNAAAREEKLGLGSLRQADEVEARVAALGRRDLSIIDVGCGTGWLCERLAQYGRVTGVDMTPSVLERASRRVPQASFLCGDIHELDLPAGTFDVVVTLEVLSHVADQAAFVARLGCLLKPGGLLVLATQNRPIYERMHSVAPPHPSQIRKWVDARALRSLLDGGFVDVGINSLVPMGNRGFLRVVNSVKLNEWLQTLMAPGALQRAKERALLGSTLLAHATRR
jgi:2-polyprenyl-3-methyl-5-hydroxy-6-metoxy-1,4-benzoquinol methylase